MAFTAITDEFGPLDFTFPLNFWNLSSADGFPASDLDKARLQQILVKACRALPDFFLFV